jgi:hypothetical protein
MIWCAPLLAQLLSTAVCVCVGGGGGTTVTVKKTQHKMTCLDCVCTLSVFVSHPLFRDDVIKICWLHCLRSLIVGSTRTTCTKHHQVAKATQHLTTAFSFVGITDYWNESICLFHAQLGGSPLPSAFINNRPSSQWTNPEARAAAVARIRGKLSSAKRVVDLAQVLAMHACLSALGRPLPCCHAMGVLLGARLHTVLRIRVYRMQNKTYKVCCFVSPRSLHYFHKHQHTHRHPNTNTIATTPTPLTPT